MEDDERRCVCGEFPVSQVGARCPSCPPLVDENGCLSQREWRALAAAEEVLYENDRGALPVTTVLPNPCDSPLIKEMWEWVELHITDTTDPSVDITGETALRVATAIRHLSFGY